MSSFAAQYLFGKERKRTLMLGLENSGKTTILNQLRLGEVIISMPSADLQFETMKYKTNMIISWDVPAKAEQSTFWRPQLRNTAYLIFVVDSADGDRIQFARNELHQLLAESELSRTHLLVYANKKDLPNAMNAESIADMLGLHSLTNRQWHVEVTCATSCEGLFEGLDWLMNRFSDVK